MAGFHTQCVHLADGEGKQMMKNVQGSSAGAGSGEFHVYKQNRRREYERLKLMDEKAQKVRFVEYQTFVISANNLWY